MKHYGDITKINGADVEAVDIITGGSPCQDLSVAGKQKGLAGERSGLFMEQMRIIKEMRAKSESEQIRSSGTVKHVRPRFMVWENVPGAFSSNNGEDFRTVLEEVVRVKDQSAIIPRPTGGKWTPSGCIMGDGWSVAWRVHDAQFWGVPQRRKRIALVADFDGGGAPEILFERKGLPGNTKQGGTQGEETAGHVKESAGSTSVYCLQGNGIDRALTAGCNGKGWREDQCYTLNTIDRPAIAYGVDAYNQQLTNDKTMSITGAATDPHHIPCVIEKTSEEIALFDAYQHHGYRAGETCGTLTAEQNNSIRGDTPLVCYSNAQFGGYSESDKAAVLKQSGGDHGGAAKHL